MKAKLVRESLNENNGKVFSFFGYIPFNNKLSIELVDILINKIKNNEIKVNCQGTSYSLDLGINNFYSLDVNINNFRNILLVKGIISTPKFMKFNTIIDTITFGSSTTYMLVFNDRTDDVIFIGKNQGKQLFDLCQDLTNMTCEKGNVITNMDNLTPNKSFQEKIKNLINLLKLN